MIKILHSADSHLKIRENDFSSAYEKTAREIENIIREKQIDIYVFAGDFTDVYPVNDIERKLLYKHLGNILNIPTLKELVIMNGNHDLPRNKKIIDLERENNPLDTFVNTSQYLTEELSKKVTYLKQQKEYLSKCNPNISWVSYSLEDGMSKGSNLKLNPEYNLKYRIPIYHDILDEYIIDSGLPVSQNKRQYLANMDTFDLNPNYKSLILAGDIHKKFTYHKDNKTFIYPGSNQQVNYGEGSYLKINKNQIFKPADSKVVKYYELELDENNISNTDYRVTNITLTNNINYITIDFNTKFFIENWKEQLISLLEKVEYSENINNVKIEFSSFYMKYEIDILNIVNEKLNTINALNYIEPIYGTIIFKEENPIELNQEIQLDSDGNIIDIDSTDITLDTENLSNIFGQIVNSYSDKIKKEFTNPEEYDKIINEIQTLFDEQINMVYGNKKSNDIELLDIYTNGFMALGENKVNLNIPGLTRIVANNGIGKTTLFNLIRYIITDMVIEGLAKNKSKENLLLTFNDKLHTLDDLKHILNFKVNKIPVNIERNVKRIWNVKTTDKQKKSKNWRNYVDSVSSTLKLTVIKESGNTVLLNEEAQRFLNAWFGATPETILILNQYKILTMLNASGEKLKELILEYIGIDYLKSLEKNLEMVKDNYNIQKPETPLVQVANDKINIKKGLQEIEDNETKLNERLSEIKIEKANVDKDIELNFTQSTSLGDVPQEILNIKNQIQIIESELSMINLDELKLKEMILFNLTKPSEIILDNEKEQIQNLNKEKFDLIQSNNELVSEFNNFRLEKIKQIDENVARLEEENSDYLKNEGIKILELNNEVISNINVIKKEYINKLDEFRKTTVELNQTHKEKDQKELDEITIKYNNLITEINNLTNKIDNAFCLSCNKPLDLTQEEIESFKITKEEKISESKLIKNNIDKLKENIKKYDEEINHNNNGFQITKTKLNWDSTQNALIVLENELKILEEIKCSKLPELLPLYNNCIDNHVKSLNLIKSEEYLKKNKIITDLNAIKSEVVVMLNINIQPTEKQRNVPFIKNAIDIFDKHADNELKAKNIDDSIKLIEDDMNKRYKDNQKEIDDYQKLYQNYLTESEKINKHNQSVNEQNSNYNKLNTNLETLKTNLKSKEENVDKYNYLKEEKIQLNNKQNLLISENNEITIKLNNYKNFKENTEIKLKEILEIEQAWTDYRFKNYIYKTFEKIIKDDFKYAIFNYYRQFLNTKLNILLEGLDFRLYWNEDSNLYLVALEKDEEGNNEMIYRPVKIASGMQSSFLGLSLIYAIHMMNVRNNISHIFIDEISGQLNDGKNINSEENEEEVIDNTNYQEKLVKLLSKFDTKKVMIVDHVIQNLFETHTYYVVKKKINGQTVGVYK